MAYRTVNSEENDTPEGQDQVLSPFIQFDTEEDANNSDKRMDRTTRDRMKKTSSSLFPFRIALESPERSWWLLFSRLSIPSTAWILLHSAVRSVRPCVSGRSPSLQRRRGRFLVFPRQFIFIVSFTTLLVQCIDYPLLFRSTPQARNITDKIHFNDVIQPPRQCLHK